MMKVTFNDSRDIERDYTLESGYIRVVFGEQKVWGIKSYKDDYVVLAFKVDGTWLIVGKESLPACFNEVAVTSE